METAGESSLTVVGLVIVAPIWGAVWAELAVQALFNLLVACIYWFGFLLGRAPRRFALMGTGVGLLRSLLHGVGLAIGTIIVDMLPVGSTLAEILMFWLFAAFTAAFVLPQLPTKIKRAWDAATTPTGYQKITHEA